MNKDGFEATLETSHKRKPANSEYEGKVEIKAGGYELGPVKGWSEVSHYLIRLLFQYIQQNLLLVRDLV